MQPVREEDVGEIAVDRRVEAVQADGSSRFAQPVEDDLLAAHNPEQGCSTIRQQQYGQPTLASDSQSALKGAWNFGSIFANWKVGASARMSDRKSVV